MAAAPRHPCSRSQRGGVRRGCGRLTQVFRARRFDPAMMPKDRRRAAFDFPLAQLHRMARFGLVALLAIGAVSAWRFIDPIAITRALAGYPAAPLGFIALHIAASLLFIPRMPLAMVAGLLFDTRWESFGPHPAASPAQSRDFSWRGTSIRA